jgi:epoxyqueuosine reductase
MGPAIPFESIAAHATSLGASLVGAAPVKAILNSPSHQSRPTVRLVHAAGSVIVIALAHTEEHPEMDWWDFKKGRTPGNRSLLKIKRRLKTWLLKAYSAEVYQLPYHARSGGVFLKDAAILSGLGVMGKNNLLITPQHGPRVRLSALLIDRPLECTGPLDGFAPCDGCHAPCMHRCPKDAFRSGVYQVQHCLLQMKKDEANKVVQRLPIVGMPTEFRINYCRLCELSCPVGGDAGASANTP